MKQTIQTSLLFLLLFAMSVGGFGQKGAISGTIIDGEFAEPLIGANVVISGTSIGSPTDFDGKYQFQTEPGTYTLEISYLGYQTKQIEGVEVKANETTVIDLTMGGGDAIDAVNEAVVVTAEALQRTENAVLLLRKKSDKVQDIISLQEIQRLGASTAASALTKVTGTTIVDGKYVYVRGLGDRYSSTTLNGLRLPSLDPYRNSAQLDLIPTNLIDNIVASKTFTPDLPGDFTGGNVNIKMKDLPERFTLSVSASGTYNTMATGVNDFQTFNAGSTSFLGYNDGTLDLPTALSDQTAIDLGAFTTDAAREARRDDRIAGLLDGAINAFNPQMTPTTKTAPLNRSFSFSLGNQFKLGEGQKPLGVLFTLNYSNDFDHYDNGINASYFLSSGQPQLFQNFNLRDTRSQESPSLGGLFGLTFRPSPGNKLNFYGIYSHQTTMTGRTLSGDQNDYGYGAPNVFTSSTLSFQERELTDFILSGEHNFGGAKLEWAGSLINSKQDEPDLRFFAYGYRPANDRYFISISQFDLPGRFFRTLNDQGGEIKLDLTIPIARSKNSGNSIKFGGLYANTERDFDESQYIYFNRLGNNFAGSTADYFGSDNIGVIGGESGDNLIGLYLVDQSRLSNSYIGDYTTFASYGMLTYQLTQNLKFIGGARLEGTQIYVESDAAEVSLSPEDEIAEIDATNILPSLNLVWSLSDKINVRGSYTNTIARPNMREVAPFGSFGFIGDPILFGNPDLKITKIDNYDLRIENFFGSNELVAVSGFYKTFDDPIVLTYRLAGNPQYTWKNPAEATLYGAEFEFRKNLGFIGGAFDKFSFSGNFAYIYSEVDLDSLELFVNREVDPDFSAQRDFAGQSPFVVNANLSYVNPDNGWEATVAYNYFDTRLAAAGDSGTPDVFEKGRGRLDFNLSKRVGRFTLTARARNLLDPDYERFSEFLGTEYTYGKYRVGRDFSFGLSYKI